MVKMFIMDVDGTLTDGTLNYSDKGEIIKSFNVKDGLGIKRLRDNRIIPVIITGRTSKSTALRCKELKIEHCFQGIENKLQILEKLVSKYGLNKNEIAYIGDDLNDLLIMKQLSFSAAPFDAVDEVKNTAKFICRNNGGHGAVREYIDYIIYENKKSIGGKDGEK